MKFYNALLIAGLILPVVLSAQYDSNPCDFRDTLDRYELKPHNYNKTGWYDNLDKVYLVIDDERDTDHLPDSAVATFEDIGLKIYEDHIQGNVFNGLTFFRKTDEGWKEMLLEFDHNLKTEYKVSRPDAENNPYLIEVIYTEGNAATRGSFEGEVLEVWDIKNHLRLAKIYTKFGENYSSEPVDGSFTEGRSYSMSRSASFDGKKLQISVTKIESSSSMRSNVEGEDQSEKVETSSDGCEAVSYEFKNGYFIKNKLQK